MTTPRNLGESAIKRRRDEQAALRQGLAAGHESALLRAHEEIARLNEINAELLEGCRLLLTCSLPRDVSGERMVATARAAVAKALGSAKGDTA